MLRQGLSGCFCDFNATISMTVARKIPSYSSRIRSAVHISGKLCFRWSEIPWACRSQWDLASFSVSIKQESAQDRVCINLQQVILEGWPATFMSAIRSCALPVSWSADCSGEPGFQRPSPVCPQYPQKRVYGPSSFDSHWPGRKGAAFPDSASACSGPE